MKFQNPSMHGSEVMLCTKSVTDRHTDGRTDARTNVPEAICPSNFFEVGGIMSTYSIHLQDKKKNLLKLSLYRIWSKSLRTQESVPLIHGNRAIGVRATEVLL